MPLTKKSIANIQAKVAKDEETMKKLHKDVPISSLKPKDIKKIVKMRTCKGCDPNKDCKECIKRCKKIFVSHSYRKGTERLCKKYFKVGMYKPRVRDLRKSSAKRSKSARKSRKASRKGRKSGVKRSKSARKSRKASRKGRKSGAKRSKSTRKSRKSGTKRSKSTRKSRKASRKGRKSGAKRSKSGKKRKYKLPWGNSKAKEAKEAKEAKAAAAAEAAADAAAVETLKQFATGNFVIEQTDVTADNTDFANRYSEQLNQILEKGFELCRKRENISHNFTYGYCPILHKDKNYIDLEKSWITNKTISNLLKILVNFNETIKDFSENCLVQQKFSGNNFMIRQKIEDYIDNFLFFDNFLIKLNGLKNDTMDEEIIKILDQYDF